MAMQYSRTLERHLPAPPELVWGLVADTNRWDRLVGFHPTQYRYSTREAEGDEVRARIGHATQSWGEAEWIERGEWVEGQSIHGMRHYLSGPAQLGGFRAELQPSEGGVRVSLTAYLESGKPFAQETERRILQAMEQAQRHYLDALEQLLRSPRGEGRLGERDEPAVIQARRLLGRLEPDGSAFGIRSEVHQKELHHRAQRFTIGPVSAEVRARIVRFAAEGFDDDLTQIRPFELSRMWGFDRRSVLQGFLHATRAGLYELRWQLTCPLCRGSAQEEPSLESLKREGYCIDCDRSFSLDFASNVEATFRVSPAIRAVAQSRWCVASPGFRPHILANFIVPPQGRREVSLELPEGAYSLLTTMHRYRAGLPARQGARLQVTLDPQALGVTVGVGEEGASRVTLELVNATPHEEEFSIERADWRPEAVLGKDMLMTRDFHELFATEAPATGVDLALGSSVVMFLDLTGTTALYEQVGDAKALVLLKSHFILGADTIERNGGAMLKTMGDAMMALFPSAGAAFSAALDIARFTRQYYSPHELQAKVGIHEGPCLAVRANQRLELFGATVNLAARLHAEAKGGQVVLLESLLQDPKIRELVEGEQLKVKHFQADLRGRGESQACVAVTAWVGPKDVPSEQHG